MSPSYVPPRHPWRRRLVLTCWLVMAVVLCVRAAQIQVVQGGRWQELAEDQHGTDLVVEAARGRILDRHETPLAVSRERVRVNVAPHELVDRPAVHAELDGALGLAPARASRYTAAGERWRVVPGLYPVAAGDRLDGIRGVYVDRVMQRFHPHGDLARGLLGAVVDGESLGGIERAFEDVLQGTPGREVVARDVSGNEIPGERLVVEPPRSGGTVVLTLNTDLQEIAQQALREAIEQTGARGGDILVTDPHTGEVLALFSTQDGNSAALTAVTTPFEPGSTLKPFTVAGLLEHDLVSLNDVVDVADGRWAVHGRVLRDDHTTGRITVREALRESSNVGIAKVAQRMTPAIQYETLRDFGFGALTGVGLSGEMEGILRRPDAWQPMSQASLAIGYEVSVTALQMAMAYGALANGGELMQPQLVRELRDSDGDVIRTFERRVIRRVVRPEVALALGRTLVDVVEDGTGRSARLGSFLVAGKSGTAWWNDGSGYERGAYSSSFVGYFPADKPQLVVFVKLDRPQTEYYGGAVAAPVTRATMEAALAASGAHLDRQALLASQREERPAVPPEMAASLVAQPIDPPIPPLPRSTVDRVVARLEGVALSLPDVAGLPARVAVRRLHALGLRVERVGIGDVRSTVPRPGARVLPGDTVRLTYRGGTYD